MAFNSLVFLIFIALFALGWPIAKRHRQWRYAYIVIASFIFYGWWDWRFLFLIILSGTVDFFAGLLMQRFERPLARRLVLAASIIVNLGTLLIFKYSGFVADIIDGAIGSDLKNNIPLFMLILPVGISFYTFQSMSYTIDVYRRKIRPTANPLHFFAFLSLFPQLVAGPIIRATELLWRMEDVPKTTEPQRFAAMRLIVAGYVQKLLIADNIARAVDKAFANPMGGAGTLFWWGIMIAFSIQIYCDFAGYSNIARGLLKFMGYNIKANFRFPYFAQGFRDFWNRWHISLSHWFRDYVYIPLGGAKRELNMWVTMLLSGLWHGANFTFLGWAALHASYLSIERKTRWPSLLHPVVAAIITFAMTTIAWVFFRSASFPDALHILGNMLWPNMPNPHQVKLPLDTMVFFLLFELYGRYMPLRRLHNRAVARNGEVILLGVFLSIAIIFRGPGHGFIYFQF